MSKMCIIISGGRHMLELRFFFFFFRAVTAKSKSSLTPGGKKQTQPGTNTNPSWKEGHFWLIIS